MNVQLIMFTLLGTCACEPQGAALTEVTDRWPAAVQACESGEAVVWSLENAK